MLKKQFEKINSYKLIEGLIEKEKMTFNLLPDFAARATSFSEAVAGISTISPEQWYANMAERLALSHAKARLRSQLMLVIRKLVFYADTVPNDALTADVDYTSWELARMRTVSLIDVARMVLERATKVLPEATLAQLSQADLDPIVAAIDDVVLNQTAFRNWQLKNKRDTKAIQAAFVNADAALAKLNLSVGLLEHSNPTLFAHYQDAKKVLVSYRKLSVMASVVYAKTEYPVSGVTIEIRKLGEEAPSDLMITTPKKQKKSTALGSFIIRNLVEGDYLLTASKVGMITNNIPFTVAASETTKLNILMNVA